MEISRLLLFIGGFAVILLSQSGNTWAVGDLAGYEKFVSDCVVLKADEVNHVESGAKVCAERDYIVWIPVWKIRTPLSPALALLGQRSFFLGETTEDLGARHIYVAKFEVVRKGKITLVLDYMVPGADPDDAQETVRFTIESQ